MKELPLIRHGSVKSIHRVDATTIAFRFNNTFSAFDVGPHHQEIPFKAQALCKCAVTSFLIAKRVGVPTHFVEQLDYLTVRVREAQIIIDRPITSSDRNFVVPAEWISRHRVSGSILRDFKAGKKKPTDYGFSTDDVPQEGIPFAYPIHQFTTKFEDTDRELTNDEACRMAGLTPEDESEFWAMIDRLNGAMGLAFSQARYVHFDGKVECGIGPDREKLILDVFGTPDEDRPVLDWTTGPIQHYGKEYIRQELIRMGYFDALKQARSEGKPDLPYPDLPESVIDEASRRYTVFADEYSRAIS